MDGRSLGFWRTAIGLNASNARQGIKTDVLAGALPMRVVGSLNASNARQGIKTPAGEIRLAAEPGSERLQCPTGH